MYLLLDVRLLLLSQHSSTRHGTTLYGLVLVYIDVTNRAVSWWLAF